MLTCLTAQVCGEFSFTNSFSYPKGGPMPLWPTPRMAHGHSNYTSTQLSSNSINNESTPTPTLSLGQCPIAHTLRWSHTWWYHLMSMSKYIWKEWSAAGNLGTQYCGTRSCFICVYEQTTLKLFYIIVWVWVTWFVLTFHVFNAERVILSRVQCSTQTLPGQIGSSLARSRGRFLDCLWGMLTVDLRYF